MAARSERRGRRSGWRWRRQRVASRSQADARFGDDHLGLAVRRADTVIGSVTNRWRNDGLSSFSELR